MKAGWEEVALGEVALVGAGNPAPKKNELDPKSSVPFVRTSDVGAIKVGTITDSRDHIPPHVNNRLKTFPAGTVLFPKSGASTYLNHRVVLGMDSAIASHLAGIKAYNDRLDDRFLFYALNLVDAREIDQESKYPSLRLTQLKALTIPLPPLEEQKRIVSVLDAAFAKLDRARANVEANLADAEELYASCLDGIVDDLCENDRVAITEVCAFKGGSQPPKKNFVKTPRKGFVRLLQIRDYETDEKAVYVDRNLVTKFCEKDDVMIGRYGASVGRILTGKEGAYNVALVRTIPDTQKLSKPFLFYYLQSRYFQSRLLSKSERGAQNGFNKGDLSQISIPLLPSDQQQTVVETMSAVRKKSNTLSEKCEAQLADLDTLRQSLLQRAFAGELT